MPASLAPANELPKAAAHEPKLMTKRPVETIRRRAVKGVSYARTPISPGVRFWSKADISIAEASSTSRMSTIGQKQTLPNAGAKPRR